MIVVFTKDLQIIEVERQMRVCFPGLNGPAGAFAQEYTVIPSAFSDKKLYGHEKASQGRPPVSDCTVK
jgi:hypothetical protein